MIERGDTSNFDSHVLHVPHVELERKTLGLVGGLGDTGSATAGLARALGMRVLNFSRSGQGDEALGIEGVGSLDEVSGGGGGVSLRVRPPLPTPRPIRVRVGISRPCQPLALPSS